MEAIECLTLIFIVLKLLNIINWNWLWVISPIWIYFMFYVLVEAILVFYLERKKK